MIMAVPGASARKVADCPPSVNATRCKTAASELVGEGYMGTRLPEVPISSVMCTSTSSPTRTFTAVGGSSRLLAQSPTMLITPLARYLAGGPHVLIPEEDHQGES